MAGAHGGGAGGGGEAAPSSSTGGQFLLQLLQKPQPPEPPPPIINGPAMGPSRLPHHHDPAVAAMGPSLTFPPWLSNHPWPQQPLHNSLYPQPTTDSSFGFHPSLWAPSRPSSFAANPLIFTDKFQHQGQHQQEKNMLMFGSLACEIGDGEEEMRNSESVQAQRIDKAMEFNVQRVLEVMEVNGRVDGLEIGGNSGRSSDFDRGVSPHKWNNHGRRELGEVEWERQRQYEQLERSGLQEQRRVPPPGFPQRPMGVEQWVSASKRRELERNAGKEWVSRDMLNHHIHNSEVTTFGGIEENGFSRLRLVKQLDQPGPMMGSNLHSVPASDIEESLASVHGEGRRRNELTREESSRSGDEAGGSVYEMRNHLEGDDLTEHFVDSLVLGNGVGKADVGRRHSDSFNKDARLNRSREPQGIGQRRKNYRRLVRCRMDIEKFKGPFLAIYESLVPAEEEKAKHKQLLASLEKLVSKEWPRAQLYLYGSCANSFGVSNSDIDVCLAIDDDDINKSELLLRLADILQSDNLQNVQALTHARVPIVKLMDPATGLSCDICINNVLAVVNTKLLRDYGQIDGRLRQLAFIVKHWAKSRGVNVTYEGTLSSYAYVIMCIHFLQQRQPAILPCLQEMAATYVVKVDDIECTYFDRVDLLQDFGSQNKESIAHLVWAFFDYWAYRHDYTNDVISVRTGTIISKQEKDWTRRVGRDRHLICIEDPFEISHDLGRVVDKHSIRVLREEFERAANILQYDPNPCVTLFEPYVPT